MTDGRTDRQTDVQPISIMCFSIADARKKRAFLGNGTISYIFQHSIDCIQNQRLLFSYVVYRTESQLPKRNRVILYYLEMSLFKTPQKLIICHFTKCTSHCLHALLIKFSSFRVLTLNDMNKLFKVIKTTWTVFVKTEYRMQCYNLKTGNDF